MRIKIENLCNYVFSEKDLNASDNSPPVPGKSPTTPISANTVSNVTRSITPLQLNSSTNEYHHDDELSAKYSLDESGNTYVKYDFFKNLESICFFAKSIFSGSPMHQTENINPVQHNLMYDLLPKPSDGIPIPRFPPHIAAFLNGNGDANQLNALVQALYQEIVKYEL